MLLVQAPLVTGPLLVKNVPYDAVKDFTAISEIGSIKTVPTRRNTVPGTSRVGSAGYFATEAVIKGQQ